MYSPRGSFGEWELQKYPTSLLRPGHLLVWSSSLQKYGQLQINQSLDRESLQKILGLVQEG
jgi:hypothetical protein